MFKSLSSVQKLENIYWDIIIRNYTAKLKAKNAWNYRIFSICDEIKCNRAYTSCQAPGIDEEGGKYGLYHWTKSASRVTCHGGCLQSCRDTKTLIIQLHIYIHKGTYDASSRHSTGPRPELNKIVSASPKGNNEKLSEARGTFGDMMGKRKTALRAIRTSIRHSIKSKINLSKPNMLVNNMAMAIR